VSASEALASSEALAAPERAAPERAASEHRPGGRRALMRSHLVIADIAGLTLAFLGSVLAFGLSAPGHQARPAYELVVFFLSLPVWLLLASVHGLYRYDERRVGHSTVDDLVGVVHLVTLGTWIFFIGCWATHISSPRPIKLIGFWVLATLLLTGCRVLARSLCVRSPAYIQNTIIVGGGDVGQLIARKLRQHPEYGIRLLGVVDAAPRARRTDLGDMALLGSVDRLPEHRGRARRRARDRLLLERLRRRHGGGSTTTATARRAGRRRSASVRAARNAGRRARRRRGSR
jgi:FlaA1/EpsC-like NDP-sugar epimerase